MRKKRNICNEIVVHVNGYLKNEGFKVFRNDLSKKKMSETSQKHTLQYR